MPQTGNARISFGDVLAAIKAQLVADHVVTALSNITSGTPQNHPVLVGPSDLLLIARGGKHEGRDGGAAQFQVMRYVDVWVRSQQIADGGAALEDWIASTFVTGDKVLDSIGNDNWWPTDADGNLLLVESAKMVESDPPDYKISGSVYGQWVVTISCLYMPAIDPSKMP